MREKLVSYLWWVPTPKPTWPRMKPTAFWLTTQCTSQLSHTSQGWTSDIFFWPDWILSLLIELTVVFRKTKYDQSESHVYICICMCVPIAIYIHIYHTYIICKCIKSVRVYIYGHKYTIRGTYFQFWMYLWKDCQFF